MEEGVITRTYGQRGNRAATKAGVWMDGDDDARLMLSAIEFTLRNAKTGPDRSRLLDWRRDIMKTRDRAYREAWVGWER